MVYRQIVVSQRIRFDSFTSSLVWDLALKFSTISEWISANKMFVGIFYIFSTIYFTPLVQISAKLINNWQSYRQ